MNNDISAKPLVRFAFFGSSRFSVIVLDELRRLGLVPTVIVSTPDKPKGRKLALTPNEVKVWGQKHGVSVLDPARLDSALVEALAKTDCQVFVVASYGKILPPNIIDLPPHKTLNIHPSLLPRYRGPSPLQSAILADDKETGVTIMNIDAKMDHGPIVAQETIAVSEWPTYEDFETEMAIAGARLLASVMPHWIAGSIKAKEQDHGAATYTKKIVKEDGEIDLAADERKNFLKIQAYHQWPQAYFFTERGGTRIRVKITRASWKDGKLHIERVIPEGGKERDYITP